MPTVKLKTPENETVSIQNIETVILQGVNNESIPFGYLQTDKEITISSASGTITPDAGYGYAGMSEIDYTVASGSVTIPDTSITANPSISVDSSTGVITASVSESESITPTVSAGYVSSVSGATASVSGSNTSQLTTLGATSYDPTSSDQTITSGKYLTGNQTIRGVTYTKTDSGTTTTLDGSVIKKDVVVNIGTSHDADSVVTLTGTFEGGGGPVDVGPLTATSGLNRQTFDPVDYSLDYFDEVTVEGIPVDNTDNNAGGYTVTIGGSGIEPPTVPLDAVIFYSLNPISIVTNNQTKNWDGTLYYSTDYSTWNIWSGTTEISSSVQSGYHVLYLRGIGNTKLSGGSTVVYGWTVSGENIMCAGNLNNLLSYTTTPILASHAFAYLFYRCVDVDFNVTLPATTLADYCYYSMFHGCNSLTSVPQLPATTLASSCYGNMFYNCSSLKSLPSGLLPATTLADNCYQYMFYNCSSLKSLPSGLLPATTLATYCYSYMFAYCISLKSLPSGLLPATTLASSCYSNMFAYCISLKSLPSGLLPATTLATYCYYYMFANCYLLSEIPSGLLPATTLAGSCYSYMFAYCISLKSLPSGLLPATTLAGFCYYGMFSNCTSLTSVPKLPATTLTSYCYYYMFANCTLLNSLPSLPATTLTSYCYYGMFNKCPNIKLSTSKTGIYQTAYRIPRSGTGSGQSNSMSSMFNDTGGTFTGTPTINTTYYTSNTVVS